MNRFAARTAVNAIIVFLFMSEMVFFVELLLQCPVGNFVDKHLAVVLVSFGLDGDFGFDALFSSSASFQ